MADVLLVDIRDEGDIGKCEPLFREYGEWSSAKLSQDCGFDLSEGDLETAHALFRAEWPKLLGSRGRLYLATVDGDAAAVGALKPVSPESGELKRMFVRPAYRGMGIGRLILEQIIDDARQIGYLHIRLETMTYMQEAHELYRSKGFVDAAPFDAEGAGFGLSSYELFMTLSL